MNSEQEAVLHEIFPQQQGLEPHLQSSYTGRSVDIGAATGPAVTTPFAMKATSNRKRSLLPRCQHAAASPFVSAKVQFTDCKDNLPENGVDSSENDDHLERWNSASQPAADSPCPEAFVAPISPLAAVQQAASTLGSSLAWMGNYITEFVADVAGDDDRTDEEIAEAAKQKQAAKKASMENQGSVTGDLAQPLTRRHSRSSSGVPMGRAMSRGQSTRLDGDWDISPKTTPSNHFIHEGGTESDDDKDDEDAKKDS